MKKVFLIGALVMCISLSIQAVQLAQDISHIKASSSTLFQEIKKYEDELKRLESLPSQSISLVKDSYVSLERHLRVLGRYYDLKLALDLGSVNKEGVLSQLISQSSWMGVYQMDIKMTFFDLKGMDRYIVIFKFLEAIEKSYPLRVSKIIQTNDHLQVELRLYGRLV